MFTTTSGVLAHCHFPTGVLNKLPSHHQTPPSVLPALEHSLPALAPLTVLCTGKVPPKPVGLCKATGVEFAAFSALTILHGPLYNALPNAQVRGM